MANENKDVICVEATAAAISTTLINGQKGFETTNKRWTYKDSGGTMHYYSKPEDVVITDDLSTAYRVREAANNYIAVDTTDSAEVITLGNTTTNPDFIAIGSGNLGLGTATPGVNVGGGTGDTTGTVIEVENTAGIANVVIDGDPAGLIMADRGGAGNEKVIYLIVNGGNAYFTSVNDDGTLRNSDIINMDMATGYVGFGIAPDADRHVYISNVAVDTTNSYYGIHNVHTKTAGATDDGDIFYGDNIAVTMNQSAGTIGEFIAAKAKTTVTDGTVGAGGSFAKGIEAEVQVNGGTVSNSVTGADFKVNADSGTITNNIIGINTDVDVEAAMEGIAGSIYGHYINVDADEDPSGSVYMHYLNEGSNIDYGYYQSGVSPNRLGGGLKMNGRLEYGNGLNDATDARAAEQSIKGAFHIFVTPADATHDYIAFTDKTDSVVMITNNGSTNAIIDDDETVGLNMCAGLTILARWDTTDDTWYRVG